MCAVSKKRRLGKGLSDLLGGMDHLEEKKEETAVAGSEVSVEQAAAPVREKEMLLRIEEVHGNPDQPRKHFDPEALQELSDSIRHFGVLQPLLVQRDEKGGYRIIAGERRYRAAQAAGLKEIPVLVRDYSSQQVAEISIIENVQRADLNPIEEAMAYQMLIRDYGLTQEEVADKVSKSRTTITNALRLLKLAEGARELLMEGKISSGHARALLAVEDEDDQDALAERIVKEMLSVREVEKLVKQAKKKRKERKEVVVETADLSLYYQNYEDKMRSILGTKVHINRRDNNKGRVEIDYYSTAELERIMDLLRSVENK